MKIKFQYKSASIFVVNMALVEDEEGEYLINRNGVKIIDNEVMGIEVDS